jgi:hypothetical protein
MVPKHLLKKNPICEMPWAERPEESRRARDGTMVLRELGGDQQIVVGDSNASNGELQSLSQTGVPDVEC